MALSLAVISSELFSPRIQQLEKHFPDLRFHYYTYKHSKEARQIVENLPRVDALFFAGTFPYYYAKPVLDETRLAVYVMEQDEAVITTTLLQASWLFQAQPADMSVDLVDPALLKETLGEIMPDSHAGPLLQIYPEIPLESVLQFHIGAQKSGKVKVAVTSIHAIHTELSKLGYNSVYMRELTQTLKREIEQTAYSAKLAKSQKAEPAVVLIRNTEGTSAAYEAFRNLLQSPWFMHNDRTAQYVTTRQHIEYVLSLQEFKEMMEDQNVHVGIGYGLDMLSATRNAEDALEYGSTGTIFILDRHKKLYAPFTSEQRTLQLTEPKQLEIAKQLGMSPANLSRVVQFYTLHPSNQFTASDLEEFLGLTRRSTERMIKKLVDHQLVVRSGEEMTYLQGRPRAVYTFQLPEALLT